MKAKDKQGKEIDVEVEMEESTIWYGFLRDLFITMRHHTDLFDYPQPSNAF